MIDSVRALLTGATGFVGARLASRLASLQGIDLTCAVRSNSAVPDGQVQVIKGLNATTDWSQALVGQQVVIHAAARAHIMNEEVADPLAEYRRVNVEGTLNLARQAADAGAKRFIFLSSIKVNGEQTLQGSPFCSGSSPAPEDDYGLSKLEAEQGLKALADETGMEVVIIRPPLVYGLGVKANFAALMKLASRNLPLPLGSINNKRSLIALDNLVDLIVTCIDHPKAANQTFLVSDDQDVSTSELLRLMTRAAGKEPRLLPFPVFGLKLAAGLLGRKAIADRLCGSLQVDITHTKETLGWEPPVSVEEGIRRCFDR